MILRFKQAPARQPELKAAVERAVHMFDSFPHTLTADGIAITAEYLSEHFHLLDNLDLYIADDIADGIHGDICGQMLKTLRTFSLLEEDATVIVPDRTDPSYNVLDFESDRPSDEADVDYDPEEWDLSEALMAYLDELEQRPDAGNIVRIEALRARNRS